MSELAVAPPVELVSIKPVSELTDRELLEELVTSLRETREVIAAVGPALSNHPMLKMFGGSLGSLFGG